jgi:hypothetical protein
MSSRFIARPDTVPMLQYSKSTKKLDLFPPVICFDYIPTLRPQRPSETSGCPRTRRHYTYSLAARPVNAKMESTVESRSGSSRPQSGTECPQQRSVHESRRELASRLSQPLFCSPYVTEDRLCGLVVRVPGYTTEMYCASCEV